MKLYQIQKNGNRYCGPSVISALAGIGTKEAAAIIRLQSTKTAIKGSSSQEVKSALAHLGFKMSMRKYDVPGTLTLRAWTRQYSNSSTTHLVSCGNHWILVQGSWAICGKTIDMVKVSDHPHARKFVKAFWEIEKVGSISLAQKVSRASSAPKVSEAVLRRHALALAAKHGVEIDDNNEVDNIWVLPPSNISTAVDPFEEHFCYTWAEALERVKAYVGLISKIAKQPALTPRIHTH